jgi:DUF4097 and DUF4098 domain-containing protein YvlB
MKLSLFTKVAGIALIAFVLSFVFYKMSGNSLHSTISQQWFSKQDKLNYVTFNEPYSLKDVNAIVIVAENVNIHISHTDQPAGMVEFTTDANQQGAIKIVKQQQKLTINVNNLSDFPDSALTILVPDNIKIITINNQVGDISIDHVDAAQLIINGVSGDIKLDQVNVSNTNITTVDGDLHWEGSGATAVLKSVAGDVFISSSFNTPKYDIKTVSGDVNLVLAKPVNAQLDIQSVSGEVSTSHSITVSGKSGLIKIRSVSGDIQVDGK